MIFDGWMRRGGGVDVSGSTFGFSLFGSLTKIGGSRRSTLRK